MRRRRPSSPTRCSVAEHRGDPLGCAIIRAGRLHFVAYEREHMIEMRAPPWMRWTGSVLSVVAGIVVGTLSGAGAGIFTAVCIYMLQWMLSGLGFDRGMRPLHI